MSLMYQRNMGWSVWLQQFLFSPKIAGAIARKHTFPECGNDVWSKPISLAKKDASNSNRFRELAEISFL